MKEPEVVASTGNVIGIGTEHGFVRAVSITLVIVEVLLSKVHEMLGLQPL